MFEPIQIPQLLDKKYQRHVVYQEFYPAELRNFIHCIWEMKLKTLPEEVIYNTILPDACVDLLFDLDQEEIYFGATEKATLKQPITDTFHFLGVRMRPGLFQELFDFDTNKVLKSPLPYKEVAACDSLQTIFKQKTSQGKFEVITSFLLKKLKDEQIPKSVLLINKWYHSDLSIGIGWLKQEEKLTDKQLYRKFMKDYGISAKGMHNILRLHKTLNQLLINDRPNLAVLSQEASYYDQAHFQNDIKKYCGITPFEIIGAYQDELS